MDDDVELACEVVKHHNLVGHQQQDIGRADLVGFLERAQARLDKSHGFVAEVTYQAAGEARQVRDVGHVVARLEQANEF